MDEHFAARADFVAALSPGDAERAAAERHVARCHACRAALEEAKSLLTLVKRALRPPPEGDRPQ